VAARRQMAEAGTEAAAREAGHNETKAKVRARVVHVFGSQANDRRGSLGRSIGGMRARARIGLKNLAYNMRSLLHLETADSAAAWSRTFGRAFRAER